MSNGNRSTVGGWLRGTTIRKNGTSTPSQTRSVTPQVQSTSTTIYGGGVKDPSGRTSEFYSADDQCPVCKSDRYLNAKLRLMVGACYHKMCESCIDRLYTLGPGPCPFCGKILRKITFVPQTFEDLTVEKEVAIRRQIAKEFNKRREDFPDLRSYNDYLEEVEDITFNLINDIDVRETEQRIAKYHKDNAALIERNLHREEAYAQALREQEDAERRERQLRADEARQADEAERQARENEQQALIDSLERSDTDAGRLVARSRAEALKRAQARTAAANQAVQQSAALLLRTRAAQSAAVPDVPHVPLQDDWDAYEDKFVMRDTYYDPASDAVRRDREGIMRAGGYRVEEAWERALRCAVAGLDVHPLVGLSSDAPDVDVVMASA
ncbi:hypothetical protein EW146_g6635 [Bondarzewia mesenterica]|uniref:RNA polymerase II transcription factor B subunit 3 n=1 Tax=Bondarzewia mesenterica TaxID=1095465 RepID=A0A4S4LQ10_9AGAM|nr:hypothetical protein EW146_g6635 [Bondarzewia mesenterica]